MITLTADSGTQIVLGDHKSIDSATERAMRVVYLLARTMEAPILIDAGAHVGAFAVLAGLVSGMFVHAFEPNPQVLPLLWDNIYQNELEDWVKVSGFALMDHAGSYTLSQPGRSSESGLATLADVQFRDGVTRRVAACRLDDVLDVETDQFWIHYEIDIVKLDVEGAELMVLQGGERAIKRCRPAILAETQDKRTRQFGYNVGAIFNLLSGWGYEALEVTKRDTFFWHKPGHDPSLWFDEEELDLCLRFTRS